MSKCKHNYEYSKEYEQLACVECDEPMPGSFKLEDPEREHE